MTQYIDKSALVAEIERRIAEYKDMKIDSSYYEGMVASLEFFRDEFINTLEVRETDLEKEAERFVQTKEFIESTESPVILVAKHFFELGMQVSNKTQKGE